MRAMVSLQDLIDEAKARALLWAICIFAISYFLSHTSKSMWTNVPISFLILSAFRYLSYEVELRWRVPPIHKKTYLSHLEKKQLSVNDSRLSTAPPTSKWRQKIDSIPVEAAFDDFVNKILQDFVGDLWYSSITPDKDAPELIRSIILDALGEISGRVRAINLVDLLTRDVVDLIGKHLDLYRKNQFEIGVDVMGTLSFEERDERLKHQLIASSQLHPAVISPECEHQVLQRIVGGVLSIVMRPQEAKSPLVFSISRELLTCLVLQPVMNLASPAYINELIECVFLANKENNTVEPSIISTSSDAASSVQDHSHRDEPEVKSVLASYQSGDFPVAKTGGKTFEHSHFDLEDSTHHMHPRPADWASVLEAATKRRSQVLAPENLEDMWTKGRNYNKKKSSETRRAETVSGIGKMSGMIISTDHTGHTRKELVINKNDSTASAGMEHFNDGCGKNAMLSTKASNIRLKRSSSTTDINIPFVGNTGDSMVLKEPSAELTSHSDGSLLAPKFRCRVLGAYFENLGSKSFAVYSISVTDAENRTWFVKRRYRNFERLHRKLKDFPNYSLHLPPKRFLSSSIDDYFVHQRCILLDKYLQDLLSIPNLAEQHEVWDFFSVSSKNYAFGKSPSVMKTLAAVNVDDAMDDIVRQFKDVSVGLRHAVVGSSPTDLTSSPVADKGMALSWHAEEENKNSPSYTKMDTSHSMSDDEGKDEDHSSAAISGWHSDNELNSKSFPPRVVKQMDESHSLGSQRSHDLDQFDKFLALKSSSVASDIIGNTAGMPPEWTPPNVSVPLLNLVDKMFQLNRRGWLRRQVLWISKQILQLMMEDAIDDWILRQIHLLRNDEIIAQGIRWIHNVLWPNGTFFIKLRSTPSENSSQIAAKEPVKLSSFELQLQAARRASDVKKMILGGAPTTLVSLIGNKQYHRCAKDIYYFLQSSLCVKHLAYSTLELLVVSIFPELRELIRDIHEKARTKPMYEK